MQLVLREGSGSGTAGYDLVSDSGVKFAQIDISDDTMYIYPAKGAASTGYLPEGAVQDDEFRHRQVDGFYIEHNGAAVHVEPGDGPNGDLTVTVS